MELFSQLKYLHLNIGTTFSPEHLNDLFKRAQTALKHMSLRFRPYVEKVTYYQFLKGSYSDSMIEEMSKWPALNDFKYLSILQDPLPTGAFAPQTNFAQPIVFFSLEVIRLLAVSSLASTLTHLRIRVPSRPVVAQLLTPGSFPNVSVLDIGTTALGNPLVSLPKLMNAMPRVKHLLLDSCCLSREGWKDLGRGLAIAGLSKATAREKAVKVWVEENQPRTADHETEDAPRPGASTPRRARRGRRGLAAATFSIRARSPPRQPSSQAVSSQLTSSDAQILRTGSIEKIRILPQLSTLESFSTTLSPKPDSIKRDEWQDEFASGWLSGVATISAVWSRLQGSFRAGNVRLMRFDESYVPIGLRVDESPAGTAGLLDVETIDEEFWEWKSSVPTICFGTNRLHSREHGMDLGIGSGPHIEAPSGPKKLATSDAQEDDHEPECGHARFGDSWDLYARMDRDR
ncbi:uncharacterized protein EI90DRAFT_3043804 [Cantharellus anzutake]|uniref:uncharacterized protein n=1 Tax=Cantharellus anzutake TaxID=1750568 RepID=UPI0019074B0C|nr:uncharacterized protein EI90DRAFT_3043804 [Cantharellus anzutake]KAF8336840.1 hypothetical protein EI90DRAFT_3043804 [Cantharellus anzutake]